MPTGRSWPKVLSTDQVLPSNNNARATSGLEVTTHTSLGDVAEADSTRSPGWPGNEARLHCPPASLQAVGLKAVLSDAVDSNAQALSRLVATTAVKLGKFVPRTALTRFQELVAV